MGGERNVRPNPHSCVARGSDQSRSRSSRERRVVPKRKRAVSEAENNARGTISQAPRSNGERSRQAHLGFTSVGRWRSLPRSTASVSRATSYSGQDHVGPAGVPVRRARAILRPVAPVAGVLVREVDLASGWERLALRPVVVVRCPGIVRHAGAAPASRRAPAARRVHPASTLLTTTRGRSTFAASLPRFASHRDRRRAISVVQRRDGTRRCMAMSLRARREVSRWQVDVSD